MPYKRDRFRGIRSNNSEDALSWNTFRFLENQDLASFLSSLLKKDVAHVNVIYWSYHQDTNQIWRPLYEAWESFEKISQGHRSEPDIIILTDQDLIFIEAKYTSPNTTTLKSKQKNEVENKYTNVKNHWYEKVFHPDFKEIVFYEKKYELMRFWLLGSWIAKRSNLDFTLLNLVREKAERSIEDSFGKHIIEANNRKFLRHTWEAIFRSISDQIEPSKEKTMIQEYFMYRTVGYSQNGKILKAFRI